MYKSRLTRPHVREVNEWRIIEDSSNPVATVYYADIDNFFMKVVAKGRKPKYFYGETAWSDSARYAGDMYSAHLNPW